MYILFRRDDNDRTQNTTGSNPTFAIIGQDPSEKEHDGVSGPPDYGKPGPHRFIGIGMVAGLVFLALVAWFAFGKWPRKHCRCWRRRKDEDVMVEQVAVVLESSSSSSSTEEKPHGRMAEPKPKHSRKGSSRSKSKSRKGSRGMTAEGVLHVAKGDERDDVESGDRVGWEVGHIRGVRYEVRSPKEEVDQRQEGHVQKPCPVYQR